MKIQIFDFKDTKKYKIYIEHIITTNEGGDSNIYVLVDSLTHCNYHSNQFYADFYYLHSKEIKELLILSLDFEDMDEYFSSGNGSFHEKKLWRMLKHFGIVQYKNE